MTKIFKGISRGTPAGRVLRPSASYGHQEPWAGGRGGRRKSFPVEEGAVIPSGCQPLEAWLHATSLLDTPSTYATRGGAASFADGRLVIAGVAYVSGALRMRTHVFSATGSSVVFSGISPYENIPEIPFNHMLTNLGDGRILSAGYFDADGGALVIACETLDPITLNWTARAACSSNTNRPQLVTLNTGNALKIGGTDDSYEGTSFVEEYNQITNTWASRAPLGTPRGNFGAVVMPNGNVLVMGGVTAGGTTIASAEIYNPTLNTWTSVAAMPAARKDPGCVLLPDGRVFVAGGIEYGYGPTAGVIYNPGLNTWTTTATDMQEGKTWEGISVYGNGLLLRPCSGDVYAFGGSGTSEGAAASTVDVYTPATDTWTPGPALPGARAGGCAALLPDGSFLIAGGEGVIPYRSSLRSTETVTPLYGLIDYLSMSGNQVGAYNELELTPDGVTYTTGIQGQAAVYGTGRRSYMYGTFGNNFTLSLWVYLNSVGAEQYILDGYDSYIRVSAAGLLQMSALGFTFASTSTLPVGGWTHVAVAWSEADGILKLYVNSVEEYDYYPGTGYFNVTTVGNHETLNKYLDGRLDELGWWGRVLTPAEITTLYNSGAGIPFSSLP